MVNRITEPEVTSYLGVPESKFEAPINTRPRIIDIEMKVSNIKKLYRRTGRFVDEIMEDYK